MKRASPLVQMTLALVGLCGTLVLLADLFFGVLPNPEAQTLQLRKSIAEALAVQVATLLPGACRALGRARAGAIEGRRLATREFALVVARLEPRTPPSRTMQRAGRS